MWKRGLRWKDAEYAIDPTITRDPRIMSTLTRRRFGQVASGLALAARPAGARAVDGADIVIGLVTAKPSASAAPASSAGRLALPVRARQNDVGGSVRAGAELAVAEINGAGGVLGRQLRLETAELDPGDRDMRGQAINVARRLVAQPGLIAVIGHVDAEDALPASITYSEHNVLFIAPTITLSDLNGHGLTNVFASIPDNRDIGRQTATFAFGQGLRGVAVLRTRTAEAEEQTLAFLDQAGMFGMPNAPQISYPAGRKDFRALLADLRPKQFDMMFIAAPPEEVVLIIRQSHELQMPATFVLGGLSDLSVLIDGVRDIPCTVIVPVLEDASIDTKEQRRFVSNFSTRYERPVEDWAMQGYDAVGLLAAAIEQTQSAEPQALISTLRYAIAWTGVMGRYSFERNGRIYTRLIAFAQVRNGALSYFSLAD